MNRKTSILGLLVLTLAATPFSFAGGFIRPLVSFIVPTTRGYSNALGYGAAAGLTIDQAEKHEFSLEVNYSQWKEEENFPPNRWRSEESYLPVLINYRYYFGSVTSMSRFFFGPSVGVTQARFSQSFTGPFINSSDSATDWMPAFSASTGFSFNLGDSIVAQLGYRIFGAEAAEVEMFGRWSKRESFTANIAFLELGTRF